MGGKFIRKKENAFTFMWKHKDLAGNAIKLAMKEDKPPSFINTPFPVPCFRISWSKHPSLTMRKGKMTCCPTSPARHSLTLGVFASLWVANPRKGRIFRQRISETLPQWWQRPTIREKDNSPAGESLRTLRGQPLHCRRKDERLFHSWGECKRARC